MSHSMIDVLSPSLSVGGGIVRRLNRRLVSDMYGTHGGMFQ